MLLNRILIFCFILFSVGTAKAQTLDEYLVIAAENNPGIKAKYFAYQAALEKVPQVGSLPDPQLSFGYFILPVETRTGAQQAQFSISQMFPWFGSLSAKKDAATLKAQVKFEAFEAGKDLLYYQVKKLYFQLWELERDISLMQDNLEILQSYESLATTKYENGKAGLVDVIRVQLRIEEAENDLMITKQKREPLTAQFNSLLNRQATNPVITPLVLPEAPSNVTFTEEPSVSDNPLLAQLDLKSKNYQAQLKAAKKEGLPKISLGLNYTIVQDRTDMDVPDNGNDILMPRLSISLPLYRKKYNAMQSEALLNMQSANEDKTNIQNILLADHQEYIWNYNDARSRIGLFEGQIKKSESALNILITSYSSDNNDFEEVLRMQQQILKYQMHLVKARADLRVANAGIIYITGQ